MRKMLGGALAAVALLMMGCSGGDVVRPTDAPTTNNPDPTVLDIVMGSEQRSIFDEIVRPWCAQNGLTCTATELGSVDQANLLGGDCGRPPRYDVFWFASTVFEQIGNEKCGALVDSRPTFTSPVVFAGWRHVMDGLGFTPGSNTTIQQIIDAVEADKANVWITNPSQSNSGATAYLGFLNYFAGNPPGKALTQEQLDSEPVRTGITQFMGKFQHTPPSTKTMMDQCIASPDRCDAVFTYEALVIELNRDRVARGEEPMTVVYPQGSLAFADSPLGFLPHADGGAEKKANFEKLQNYLLGPDAQQALLQLGRRPVNTSGLSMAGVPKDVLDNVFRADWGIVTDRREQPIRFPAATVIENALYNYNTEYRQPGNFVYCIDGSGSMEGAGWDGVTGAANILFDPDNAKRYMLTANPRDSTTVLIFNGGIKGGPWTVDGNRPEDLRALRDKVTGTSPGGETNLRGCLARAAFVLGADPRDTRKKAVVLMTDGQDGSTDDTPIATLAAKGIPVIAIGFGDVDEVDLRDVIAGRTGGTFIHKDDVVGALRDAAGFR